MKVKIETKALSPLNLFGFSSQTSVYFAQQSWQVTAYVYNAPAERVWKNL
jgi:hypothetical protein